MNTQAGNKYTRQQYMDGEVSHADYYGQFVTPFIKERVKSEIGLERLLASTDEHLNDISLQKWDRMALRIQVLNSISHQGPFYTHSYLQAGKDNSLSAATCILKQAARQIIKEASDQ